MKRFLTALALLFTLTARAQVAMMTLNDIPGTMQVCVTNWGPYIDAKNAIFTNATFLVNGRGGRLATNNVINLTAADVGTLTDEQILMLSATNQVEQWITTNGTVLKIGSGNIMEYAAIDCNGGSVAVSGAGSTQCNGFYLPTPQDPLYAFTRSDGSFGIRLFTELQSAEIVRVSDDAIFYTSTNTAFPFGPFESFSGVGQLPVPQSRAVYGLQAGELIKTYPLPTDTPLYVEPWGVWTNVTGSVTLTNHNEAPIFLHGTGAVAVSWSGLRSPRPVYLVARGMESLSFLGAYGVSGATYQTNASNHFVFWSYGTNVLFNAVTATED